MSPLIWAILILALAIILLILEMFIPSAGLLTFLSVTALIASVVMVFVYQGLQWGTAYLVSLSFLLPAVAAFLIKWWPKTPIGRRILNLPPLAQDSSEPADREATSSQAELIGQVGRARTKMLPSGVVQVAGRTFDAVSEGVPIDRGEQVEVIQVRGNRIIVRPTGRVVDTAEDAEEAAPKPLDAAVPDPFDDSLA